MLVLNILQGYLSYNCSEYYISNGQKRKARKSDVIFLVEYKSMFNNRLYKIANRSPSGSAALYDELRKDLPNQQLFLYNYMDYLLSNFELSKSEISDAMNFAEELLKESKSIRNLNEIFFYIRKYNLDKDFLRAILKNPEAALYSYVMKNLGSFKLFINGEEYPMNIFLEKSEKVRKNFLMNDPYNFKFGDNITANDIYRAFKYTKIYADKMYDGNLNKALDLIKNFNNSSAHILPLVYHKQKTHRFEGRYREQDIQSKKLLSILSNYINEDRDNRMSIVDSLTSLDNFVGLISNKYPDLLGLINNSNISLGEYDNRLDFSYLKSELSKLQIINPSN